MFLAATAKYRFQSGWENAWGNLLHLDLPDVSPVIHHAELDSSVSYYSVIMLLVVHNLSI